MSAALAPPVGELVLSAELLVCLSESATPSTRVYFRALCSVPSTHVSALL